ncbi:MAG: protein phosphatase 2C domain-containing protein [Anaerolineaceae bacterium]
MNVNEERYGNLIFVTASDIGSNHQKLGQPNQDAVAYFCVGEDFVLSVSDGVGSCKKAELGSRFVVDSSLKLFQAIKNGSIPFETDIIAEKLIELWHSSIADDNIDDYCATLKAVFKIVNQVKVFSIGDGFIAISSDGINLISPIEETHFTNETNCLNAQASESDFWTAEFYLDTFKPYVIFCCTDGIANGILPGKEINLVEEIEKDICANELRHALEEFLSDVSNYCFDDKTVGVVKYER